MKLKKYKLQKLRSLFDKRMKKKESSFPVSETNFIYQRFMTQNFLYQIKLVCRSLIEKPLGLKRPIHHSFCKHFHGIYWPANSIAYRKRKIYYMNSFLTVFYYKEISNDLISANYDFHVKFSCSKEQVIYHIKKIKPAGISFRQFTCNRKVKLRLEKTTSYK